MNKITITLMTLLITGCAAVTTYRIAPKLIAGKSNEYVVTLYFNIAASDGVVMKKANEIASKLAKGKGCKGYELNENASQIIGTQDT